MLKAVSRLQPLYHSPTTWPLRMTSNPVAPSAAALCSHAAASLSQSPPAALPSLAVWSSLGAPLSGRTDRQPPLLSGGGQHSASAGFSARADTTNSRHTQADPAQPSLRIVASRISLGEWGRFGDEPTRRRGEMQNLSAGRGLAGALL